MKYLKILFFLLVSIAVTAAFWVFKDLLFPFVTSKAFFFRIVVELALPLYAYFLVMDKRLRPNLKNPLNIAVLVFMVLNFVSSFSGVNMTRSLWGNFERMGGAYYIAHLTALYFYVLCLGQMGNWYLQWFLKVLLGVGAVVAINGISGWLGGPTLVMDPTLPTRISSTLGNPIYVGSFLIIPLYLCLFFAHQRAGIWNKIFYYSLVFLNLAAIYLSGTRGAVLGILVASFLGALVYLFFQKSKKIKIYGFTLVGILAIFGILLFIFNEKLPQGSNVRRIFNLTDSNTFSRLLQWKVALEGYPDRPLLGVGPENYYIVANQYYDPKIAEYDPSWFDKPHNYLLEILVTGGAVGFITYSAIVILLLYAFYRGYKSEFYGLLEFCFLITALLAYQIQNLFVFDTVPASLMFFAFAGFAAYIWNASKTQEIVTKPKFQDNRAFGLAVCALSLLVMIYAQHATNIIPLRIAKNVNYGYAYASADVERAISYFKTATTLPFNFDDVEVAGKYADFAAQLARTADEQHRERATEILQESTAYLKKVTEKYNDNPILWQRLALAQLYSSVAIDGRIIVNPEAVKSVLKAIDLAPKRNEAKLTLAQIRGFEGKAEEAGNILQEALKNIPSDRNAKIQLVNFYKATNQIKPAVETVEQLLALNQKFAYAEIKWLIDYYVLQKDFDKALALQKKLAENEPQNVQIFVDWVALYIKVGKFDEARNLAANIVKYDPSKQAEVRALLENLPTMASSSPITN